TDPADDCFREACLACDDGEAVVRRHLFFFAGSRRHTILHGDWSSGVCFSDRRQGCVCAVSGGRADAHVSGLELWYDPRKRVGHRVTKVRLANGHGLDDGRSYTVAVSDFLATGGSGYSMFRGQPAEDAGLIDLDVLIRYLAVL